MKTLYPRPLELLAPARDAQTALTALRYGADAVYMGGPSHGARAAAINTVEEIHRVADEFHKFDGRVYVTLNTLVYENELKDVEKLIKELYYAQVDGLIVQDMSILRLDIPPIALHASTQCNIQSPDKARFLAQCGFSQLVLPREFTLDEIAEVRRSVPNDIVLEGFIHGALCVSYSGDCQASAALTGRSANRGECAQICRLPYSLIDGEGNILQADRHLLSLRDLNRQNDISTMAAAGISSFKIEGRLKDEAYVKNTVASYRRTIDALISEHPDKYCRQSVGNSQPSFDPDLSKSFNRGFTTYFLTPNPKNKMGSHLTPKWAGTPIGRVVKEARGKRILIETDNQLAAGDGLTFFDKNGKSQGFRVNKVEGQMIISANDISIPSGTTLYRNRDKVRDDKLTQDTARRTINVDCVLRSSGSLVVCDLKDETGLSVTSSIQVEEMQTSRTPQHERRRQIMEKTGETVYTLRSLDDRLGDLFIPASLLTDLRRRSFELLSSAMRSTRKIELRRPEDINATWPGGPLSYHDNVANSLAETFYKDHGAKIAQRAFEIEQPKGKQRVMTCRYCLRRELGLCLKTERGRKVKEPLTLKASGFDLTLHFDCGRCRMEVWK